MGQGIKPYRGGPQPILHDLKLQASKSTGLKAGLPGRHAAITRDCAPARHQGGGMHAGSGGSGHGYAGAPNLLCSALSRSATRPLCNFLPWFEHLDGQPR